MRDQAEHFDCQACGACCRAEPGFGGGVYVRLELAEVDALLEAEADWLVTADRAGRPSLRLKQDASGERVCAALEGRLGVCVECTVYEARPGPCRAFESGTEACRLARQEAGVGPS